MVSLHAGRCRRTDHRFAHAYNDGLAVGVCALGIYAEIYRGKNPPPFPPAWKEAAGWYQPRQIYVLGLDGKPEVIERLQEAEKRRWREALDRHIEAARKRVEDA